MQVLISDKIADSSFSIFKDNNIEFDYSPEITPVQLKNKITDYDALIVRSRTKVTQEIIDNGKSLKVIGRAGSGVDNIDTDVCKSKGIIIVNAPDANSQAVAEHAVGLMLALLRHYSKAFSSMRDGLWLKKELGGSELCGKTIGILGYGHIGKKVETLVRAFGAHPLIFSRSHKTVEFKELFEKSDIVSIHLSLNKDTKGCVTKWLLGLMKPSAILVNTSRGEIIDEEALYKALIDKKIAGAALDVYSQEPLPVDSPFRKLDNCLLTPHIGAATRQALEKASITVAEDVVRVLKGEKPKNQV